VKFTNIPTGDKMNSIALGTHARYAWARRYIYIYLALSTLSGFLELGAITLPIRSGIPFVFALVVGMAYQAGALVKDVFRFKVYQSFTLAIAGLVLGILAFQVFYLLIPSVLALGIAIQDFREKSQQQHVGTSVKRVARIVGFASAGFFPLAGTIIVGTAIIMAGLLLWRVPNKPHRDVPSFLTRIRVSKISIVMLVHQSQYFCYAYTVPYVFIAVHGLLGFKFAGAYATGWVSYTFAFLIFSKKTPLRSLFMGHVLVALSLSVMFVFSGNLWIFLATSLFAGLGGGTVFCLKLLRDRWQEGWTDMNLWEDIGHLTGLLVAAILVLVWSEPALTLLGGAVLALMTAISASILSPRNNQGL
jgi:hypothetical protein